MKKGQSEQDFSPTITLWTQIGDPTVLFWIMCLQTFPS